MPTPMPSPRLSTSSSVAAVSSAVSASLPWQGRERNGAVGRELRPDCGADRLRLSGERRAFVHLTPQPVLEDARPECDREHRERAGLPREPDMLRAEHLPALVVPQVLRDAPGEP